MMRSISISLCMTLMNLFFAIESEEMLVADPKYHAIEKRIKTLETQNQNQQQSLELICSYILQLDKYFNETENHIGYLTTKVEENHSQNEALQDASLSMHSLINKIESALSKLDRQRSFEVVN